MAQEKVNPYVIKEQNGELPIQGRAREYQDLGLIPDEEDGLDWKSREAMQMAVQIERFSRQLREQWLSTHPVKEKEPLPGTEGWEWKYNPTYMEGW